MRHHSPLPVRAPHESALTLVRSEAHVEPDSPASEVFTDLRVAPGVVVPVTEALLDTRRLMQLAGVRMAFVVEVPASVIGLVTLHDIQGERPTQAALRRGVAQVELSVGDVMTPLAHWPTLDIGQVGRAEVGDIVHTFRATGQRYLIVTEQVRELGDPAARTVVRGLFSANRVERALGHPIDGELRSRSFADLAAALDHT